MAYTADDGYVVVYNHHNSSRIHCTQEVNLLTARAIKDKMNDLPDVVAWIEDMQLDIVEV